MPASLYRLAGKPHHADALLNPVAEQVTAEPVTPSVGAAPVISTAEEQKPEILFTESPAHDDTTNVEDASVEPAISSDTTSDASVATTNTVTWDPAWTKAQLLEVALQLNLSVTSANTKTQVIDALTAATST